MTKYLIEEIKNNLQYNNIRTGLTGLGIMIGCISVMVIIVISYSFSKNISNNETKETTIGLNITIDSNLTDEEVLEYTEVKNAIEGVAELEGVESFQNIQGEKEVLVVNGLYGKPQSVVCGFSDVSVVEGKTFDESVGNRVIIRIIEDSKSSYEIGETIYVGNVAYKIIGYTQEVGEDNTYPILFFPPEEEGSIDYMQNNTNTVGIFELVVSEDYQLSELTSEVLSMLNNTLDQLEAEFIDYSAETRTALDEAISTITVFLVVIAGISLLVAAINVVNIMYISALEKTHEIAIYRALGMRKYEIVIGFLLETGILVMFFSVLGYLIGLVLSAIILVFMNMSIYVPLWSILFIIMIGVGISIGAGLKPALKAASVSPAILLK